MTDSIRSDIGQFGILPAWFLKAKPKQRAIHLFAIITSYYANREGEAWPSRERLAEDMDVSVDTVDKAMRELVEIGIVTKYPRRRDDGGQTSNMLRITYAQPYQLEREGRTEQPPLLVQVRPRTRSSEPDPLEPDPRNQYIQKKDWDNLDSEFLQELVVGYPDVNVSRLRLEYLDWWKTKGHKNRSDQKLGFEGWCRSNQERVDAKRPKNPWASSLAERKAKYEG